MKISDMSQQQKLLVLDLTIQTLFPMARKELREAVVDSMRYVLPDLHLHFEEWEDEKW